MKRPAAIAAAVARAWYRRALRRHPASSAGYGDQMAATFDGLLALAETRGVLAVVRLLTAELAGLLAGPPHAPAPVGLPKERTPVMTAIAHDIRYAFRTFARRPAFTGALVLTLALGIGANTAIFSVVKAVLLQPLPFKDPQRLVMVWEDVSAAGFPRNTPAPGNYLDWKQSTTAFAGIAAIDQRDFNLTGAGEPEKIGGAGVTPDLFDVLGVEPVVGRLWRADEDVPGNHVAVIGYGLWQRRFAGDRAIAGTTVSLNGLPYTVLGVLPARFQILSPELQVFVPLAMSAARMADRGSHYLSVVGRLAPGVTLERANVQLSALASRLEREHPDTNRMVGMYAVPLLDDYVGDTRTILNVLLAAVACVLLVACANVANLMLADSADRARELVVRAALGADRRRLIRQLLTESLVLATAGGIAGTAIAAGAFGTLRQLVPEPLADLSRLTLDWTVLAVTAAVTLATGVLFGLAPAVRASRVNPRAAGANASARGLVGSGAAFRQALVIAEIACASALLVGAGLFVQSYRAISAVNLGFRPQGVLTARVQLPRPAYGDAAKRVAFVHDVLERVRALPGVRAAGYTSAAPLVWKGGTSGFMPEADVTGTSLSHDAVNRVVSPGYMETIGMTLVAGRFFDEHDTDQGEPVAIINERMASQYWPGQDALGRRFTHGSDGPAPAPRRIVGIVADTPVMGIDQPAKAEMFFPLAQSAGNWMWPRDIVIRVDGDPAQIAPALRRAVASVDRQQPVSKIQTLDAIVADELQVRRLQMRLMSAFAGLALLLAAVGIYGVLSHAVTARTKEIGLRVALGGNPSRIRWRIVRHGMALGLVGVAAGTAAAFWGARLAATLLFRVSTHDAVTFTSQAAALLAVCLVAAYLPARRASRIDPMSALRGE